VQFPPVTEALEDPNGLLAAGGELSMDWLLAAYKSGIFPWYEEGQPLLWWSPDPRLVLFPGEFHASRSLKKLARQQNYQVTMDQAFPAVIKACSTAEVRQGAHGTWITTAMQSAYQKLHEEGYAHSVEIWSDGNLAGGLYGLSIGSAFFGESMFSLRDNASKLALLCLARQLESWGYDFIDCQVTSNHLLTLGAREISRARFMKLLAEALNGETRLGQWIFNKQLLAHEL